MYKAMHITYQSLTDTGVHFFVGLHILYCASSLFSHNNNSIKNSISLPWSTGTKPSHCHFARVFKQIQFSGRTEWVGIFTNYTTDWRICFIGHIIHGIGELYRLLKAMGTLCVHLFYCIVVYIVSFGTANRSYSFKDRSHTGILRP